MVDLCLYTTDVVVRFHHQAPTLSSPILAETTDSNTVQCWSESSERDHPLLAQQAEAADLNPAQSEFESQVEDHILKGAYD